MAEKNCKKEMNIMRKIPLIAQILIGFVAGTLLGLFLSECCAPETVKTQRRRR